jgi:hypothetical protein
MEDSDPLQRLAEAYDDPHILEQVEDSLQRDPTPLLLRTFEMLGRLPGKVDRPIRFVHPIELIVSPQRRVDARSSRVRGRRRSYKVEISSAFYHLLNDVADIVTAQSAMVSLKGEVITPAEFDRAGVRNVVGEALVRFVKDNQWTPIAALDSNRRERTRTDAQLPPLRRKGFGVLWKKLLMTVFVLGHEIGHIVEGHCDPRFFKRRVSRQEEELRVDQIGAKFLIDYISVPPEWWADRFDYGADLVVDLITNGARLQEERQRYHKGNVEEWILAADAWVNGQQAFRPVSEHEIILRQGLIAVAAMFVIYELAEKTAEKAGLDFTAHYPSAAVRFKAFRQYCITDLELDDETFSSFGGLQWAPDNYYEYFRELLINTRDGEAPLYSGAN